MAEHSINNRMDGRFHPKAMLARATARISRGRAVSCSARGVNPRSRMTIAATMKTTTSMPALTT